LVATTTNTDAIDKHLSAVLGPDLISEYTGMKQCAIGVANEARDLARFEHFTGDVVLDRNNRVYRKVILSTCDDSYTRCDYIVSGCVDGIINGDTVVESKNRMRRLFKTIPEYEQVQLEVYMWLTDLKKAVLVENYDTEQFIIPYEHSPDKWKEIVINFELFHEELQLFRNDPNRDTRVRLALMNKRT
jgi:hypothetical protein